MEEYALRIAILFFSLSLSCARVLFDRLCSHLCRVPTVYFIMLKQLLKAKHCCRQVRISFWGRISSFLDVLIK